MPWSTDGFVRMLVKENANAAKLTRQLPSDSLKDSLPIKMELVESGKLALPDEKTQAAVDLADHGYNVTVYEASPAAGGMFRWGIPEYRIPKNTVDYEIELIRRKGIKFVYIASWQGYSTLSITGKNAAVFLSLGLQSSRKLGVEGEGKTSISYGVEFLRQASHKSNSPEIKGKVLVVGGGNVAIDVARTAQRVGTSNVEMVCLEQRYAVAASPEEDITVVNGWGPKWVLGNDKVGGIEFKRCTSVYDVKYVSARFTMITTRLL